MASNFPQFTPETFGRGINDEDGGGKHSKKFSMWRHFGRPIEQSYVVIITGGVANPSPGYTSVSTDQENDADEAAYSWYSTAIGKVLMSIGVNTGDNGKAVFRGGTLYTVSAAEKVILVAAGYTVPEPS